MKAVISAKVVIRQPSALQTLGFRLRGNDERFILKKQLTACYHRTDRMLLEFFVHQDGHRLGDSATRPIALLAPRLTALLRLARHASSSTLGRVQLLFLGLF
jgi:hypothetical protein